MSLRLVVCVLFLLPLGLSAQPAAKGPKKKDDVPPGYKKDNLRGFTLYFSNRVLEEDRSSKLPRKPLEALEQELIIVETVLPADKVKKLKAVPIWVEWDERIAMGNGRGGGAVAVFLGGHQSDLLDRSNPVKSNAVTILSLRSLTAEHQPATDSGRCVTLHELAHAFHYHVVGENNQQVKDTYKQAMERKLYDRALYVATNEHEYFAELTCCYLEKLDYFPRTRDELKKHDPKGYDLMEKTWGKVIERKVVAAKGPKLPSPDGDGQFPLTATTDKLQPGKALIGAMPDKADWKGRPVVVVQFPATSGRAVAALPRLSAQYGELRDHGLIAFASETEGAPKEFLEKLARQRGLTFPIVDDCEFGVAGRYALPHAWVFDHAGRCVFRGKPLDAEPYTRIVVGKAVLARLGTTAFGQATLPVADMLSQGAAMPQVFAKLNDQLRTNPKDSELIDLQSTLTAGGKKVLEAAVEQSKSDPVGAFFDAERLPAAYRGTPVEKPANDLLNKLRGNVKVQRELSARLALNAVLKVDTELSGKELSFEPRLPQFKEDNAVLLKKLADGIDRLRKAHPSTRAADEAARLADRWDVAIK